MVSVSVFGSLITADQACAGPWSMQPSLSAAEMFDDNVFLSETNEEGDFITILSPSVRLSRRGDQLTVSTGYRALLEFYAHNPDQNNTTHIGDVNVSATGFGPGLLEHASLALTDTFTSTQRLVNFPAAGAPVGNEGVITQPNTTLNNMASATFTLPLSDNLSGSVSYNWSFTRYKLPSLIDNAMQDATAQFSDQVTSRLGLGMTYSYHVLTYEVQGQQRRAAHELTLNANTTFSPSLSLDCHIGEAYFSDTNSLETIGAATLTKHFQYTTASVGYNRSISSGGGLFGEPTVGQFFTVVITRPMGEYASASLTGTYADQQSTGAATSRNKSFNLTATSQYAITRWLTTVATYQHMAQRSTAPSVPPTNLRDNIIAIALNGTWETPIP